MLVQSSTKFCQAVKISRGHYDKSKLIFHYSIRKSVLKGYTLTSLILRRGTILRK